MQTGSEALAARLIGKVIAAAKELSDDEYIEVLEAVSEALEDSSMAKRVDRGDFDDGDHGVPDESGWDEG